MSVTWQDLEDAQAKRQALLESYVVEIASTDSLRARKSMAKVHVTWSRWIRDCDFDNDGTRTDWAGVLDHLDRIWDGREHGLTSIYATALYSIDNELLKKELSR